MPTNLHVPSIRDGTEAGVSSAIDFLHPYIYYTKAVFRNSISLADFHFDFMKGDHFLFFSFFFS